MASRVEQLLSVLNPAQQVLILPHNNPDPDAIASAVALGYLLEYQGGIESQIAYQGIIGRARIVRWCGI